MRPPFPSAAQAYAESIHQETTSRHHPNARLTILPLPSLAALYPIDDNHHHSSPATAVSSNPSSQRSASDPAYRGRTQSSFEAQHQQHNRQHSYQSYDKQFQKFPSSSSSSHPTLATPLSPTLTSSDTTKTEATRSNKNEYLGTNMESLLDAVEVHSTMLASEFSSSSSSGSLSPSTSSLSLPSAPTSPSSTDMDHYAPLITDAAAVPLTLSLDSHTKRTRTSSPSLRRMSISNLVDDLDTLPQLRDKCDASIKVDDIHRPRHKPMLPRPCSPSLVPNQVTHKRKWSRLSTHTSDESRSPKIARAIPAVVDRPFNMSTVVEGLLEATPSNQPQVSMEDTTPLSRSMTSDISAVRPALTSSVSTTNATATTAIISCYHASVAQKSYGSEKRFLCPPPIVHIEGQLGDSTSGLTNKPQVAMSVICESGENTLGQRSTLEDDQSSTFRYLYVSGTAKAKSFQLKLELYGRMCLPNGFVSSDPSQPSSAENSAVATAQTETELPEPIAVFDSKPIAIISKPSKKTAKARNVSSCILAGSLVSLFNRINSQTVRTKYMSTQDGGLCAKSSTWSAFTISIVNNGPCSPTPARNGSSKSHHRQLAQQNASPITYGAEIILTESVSGLQSDRLVVCKVENGRILQGAIGPICQMQKVALMSLERTKDSQPMYLGAVGDDHQSGRFMDHSTSSSTLLRYETSTMTETSKPGSDDFLCWTIVGISKFEYAVDLH
ncbi:hypothetical protein EDD11_003466 [Mortierella claussenii]|nr:hypothetical protein EDD11_003466 [Mortierella claussenii]